MHGKFRILGSELEITDPFVDAEVSGVGTRAEVELTEINGDRSWEIAPQEIREMIESAWMVALDDVTNNDLWAELQDVGNIRTADSTSSSAGNQLREAERRLFTAAFIDS